MDEEYKQKREQIRTLKQSIKAMDKKVIDLRRQAKEKEKEALDVERELKSEAAEKTRLATMHEESTEIRLKQAYDNYSEALDKKKAIQSEAKQLDDQLNAKQAEIDEMTKEMHRLQAET